MSHTIKNIKTGGEKHRHSSGNSNSTKKTGGNTNTAATLSSSSSSSAYKLEDTVLPSPPPPISAATALLTGGANSNPLLSPKLYATTTNTNMFDIEDMKRNITALETKLNTMGCLNGGDKIGFDTGGNVVIYTATIAQPLFRWIYGENRENTIPKLLDELKNVHMFAKMVLASHNILKTNKDINELKRRVSVLIYKCKWGLDKLHVSYSGEKDVITVLSEIRTELDAVLDDLNG